jgi:hypothetical protein
MRAFLGEANETRNRDDRGCVRDGTW